MAHRKNAVVFSDSEDECGTIRVARPGSPPAPPGEASQAATTQDDDAPGNDAAAKGEAAEEESSDSEVSVHEYDEENEPFQFDVGGPEATQELFNPDEVRPDVRSHDVPDKNYLKALQENYISLARLVWKEEKAVNRPALQNVPPEAWDDVVLGILATMPMALLLELISGNIAREYCRSQGKVWEVLAHYKRRQSQQPSIYVHILASERAESPSCDTLRRVVELLRKYANEEDHELAYDVDHIKNGHWTRSKSREGARYYLSTDKPKFSAHRASRHRVKKLLEFCSSVEARISRVPEGQWNSPLPGHPLSEVGYALNAQQRFRNHADHTQSNWLMNLVEAIFAARFQRKFWMHQYVVFFIWHPSQAIVGEALFSKLCRSYVEDGGFNYFGAGGSNWSVLTLENPELWKTFEANAYKYTPFDENVKNNELRMVENEKGRQKLREQVTAANERNARLEEQIEARRAITQRLNEL